ncbi:MAG: DUF3027 domain-containing protein [Ancrocorticia sp.]|nr:DUF3027 domain-containing protein [Ancrocorticia sp.]MCI1962709.1 DUF3027 domain-containing protein [Ancrocorticia sp.]MCI2002010.1 DUF3027 domain-containing protein [Ancrocorticia sp.]MCI2193064.1 DUF3027 domain-containing protein [Ancrocorticia sp.]
MPEAPQRGVRIRPRRDAGKEKILARMVDEAREALTDLTHPENVGEHAGVVPEGDRVLTHCFECLLPGYRGWYWAVTMARIPRSKRATVSEMALLPGEDALLSPQWIPWADRLEPSDVQPTDRLPYRADDPMLQPGGDDAGKESELLDDPIPQVRARVLSPLGREAAFERWYRGDCGPDNPATRAAHAPCSTCGYLLPMGGAAATMFGVCANEWSPFDGRAVSFDHGCGAHSETDALPQKKLWDPSTPVLDESEADFA